MKCTKMLSAFLLSAVICTASVMEASAYANNLSTTNKDVASGKVTVSWSNSYDSLNELAANSDQFVTGTVVRQTTELRHDLYFTHSFISDTNGDIYDVLQTGAVINGIEHNIPYDTPLMCLGQSYALYLKQTEYDEQYGQYYLISGGNQGIGRSISEIANNLSFAKSANSIPRMGWYWNQAEVLFYVSSSIAINYGSTMTDKVRAGINSWNSSQYSISVTPTTNRNNADVCVYMNDYGATGWDGYHNPTLIDATDSYLFDEEIIASEISLNVYLRGTGTSNNQWRAVACHEMGHSLGLDHASNVASIMRDGTDIYFDTYGYYQPQTADRNAIAEIYG